MIKKVYSFLKTFAVAFAFLFIFPPPMGKSESPGTIKLPSGEMVCDLNGEWNALFEIYGGCMQWGTIKMIVNIKQGGDRFVATKLSGGGSSTKGDEVIKGELDQKGFKKVERYSPYWGWSLCKGEITNACKKMVMDHEGCQKITLEKK